MKIDGYIIYLFLCAITQVLAIIILVIKAEYLWAIFFTVLSFCGIIISLYAHSKTKKYKLEEEENK